MGKYDILPVWNKVLLPLKGLPMRMLEIGCFEGMSTCWFLDNVLTHPDSRIDCVDTFEGDGQTVEMTGGMQHTKERFLENTAKYGEKITLHVGTSEQKLLMFNCADKVRYDIIYIDGCHLQEVVLSDAVLSYHLLNPGGILIFDDYSMYYQDSQGKRYEPKIAIDAFIKTFAPHLNTLHVGWQYIVQKV